LQRFSYEIPDAGFKVQDAMTLHELPVQTGTVRRVMEMQMPVAKMQDAKRFNWND